MPKSGRFSKEENEFIKNNCHILSPYVIAQKLDRNVKAIKDAAQKLGAIFYEAEAPAVKELKSNVQLSNSPEWEQIKIEFNADELDYFQKRFAVLVEQFTRDDKLQPTELSQIFQLIKYEILMSRNLQGGEEARQEIKRMKKVVEQVLEETDTVGGLSRDSQNFIINYENQIAALRASQDSKTREYNELNKQHMALMRELKATRDQRIKNIENDKKTWIDVIKDLQNEDTRLTYGKQNELVKLASKKEFEKMADYHKYQNDELDRPILSAETVGEDEE